MNVSPLPSLGNWEAGHERPVFDEEGLCAAVRRCREPAVVVQRGVSGPIGVAFGGVARPGASNGEFRWIGSLPGLYPEWLGDRSFQEVHGTRFAYVAGAMANGIATVDMVVAMAHAGMLGFFGSAGLSRERVEEALTRLEREVPSGRSWGVNLIHSPHEPDLENGLAQLYVDRDVRRVSASAYMALTPAIVQVAFSGVRLERGEVVRKNYVFAKISRPETARRFLSPPPGEILDKLVADGRLTASEAALARKLPVAEDITVEADSGGHTDNQILTALFSTVTRLRDDLHRQHGYVRPIRVGAAGGLGTPDAVAAAFGLGAAYVLTGSVNQACVESGLCESGRQMLAQTRLGDVVMAPAADMFEMGVEVQVLKRGTMFAPRARRLYEVYRGYPSLDAIPAAVRTELESRVLGRPIDEIWADTEAFFGERDPREVERANRDPRHKMALVFRWYLGLSSRWAIAGEPSRRMDYQIWCGPAMGAFNTWVEGSHLEDPTQRRVVDVALNLLDGAAVVTRAQQLRTWGVPIPPEAFRVPPRRLALDASSAPSAA